VPLLTLADLIASPFDDDLRLVYADQQQRVGDPRGELAVIQDRLQRDPENAALLEREDRLFAEHWDALLGPLAEEYERLVESKAEQSIGITWHLGFIRRARLQLTQWRTRETPALFDALLALSSAVLIEHLELRVRPRWPHKVVFSSYVEKLIASGPRPAMRVLEIRGAIHFDAHGQGRPVEHVHVWDVHIGRVGRLWPLYPNLEEVRLQGRGADLGPELVLPALRVFELCGSDVGLAELEVLARATWPSLERLVLWFGHLEYHRNSLDDRDLARLLASLEAGCPRLSHLALANASCTDELLASLALAPPIELLSRLRGLDLSLGTLSPAGARSLLALRPHLARLEWLNVAGSHLDPESLAQLREAWPACTLLDGDQLAEEAP
jgi:hypothetical protein